MKESENYKTSFIRREISRYYHKLMRVRYRKGRSPEIVFTDIYKKNRWGGISRSGAGSDLVQTKTIRDELPKLLKEFEINSLLDIPCGDFYWMRELNLEPLSYTGADVVDEIINNNKKDFQRENRIFIRLDILSDPLPKVDLIFCRDLFVHFSLEDITKSIKKIKDSGSNYLLTTSFTGTNSNINIVTGEWRKVNLQIPPFSFPNPLKTINEKSSEKNASDKCLLLWKISSL